MTKTREIRKFEVRKISDHLGYGLWDIEGQEFSVRIAYPSKDALRRDVKKWQQDDKWPGGIEWRETVTTRPSKGYYNGISF
jgi:hypothetical protein